MSKEGALHILRETRKLLEDPENWTCNFWARDGNGHGCSPEDPEAVCWCVEGAMRRIDHYSLEIGYLEAVCALKEPCLGLKNDELHAMKDHAGLLAWIDRGIARLSGTRLRLGGA